LKKNEDGFTLVELAIVMIIIGLLIGGVLKGQELIDNARVSSTVSAINGFKAAHFTFKDTYGGIAGDMANAEIRLSGCAIGNTNSCTFGNGNSIVGRMIGSLAGIAVGEDVSGDAENALYWKHLALADLVTGVNPSAQILAANQAWGESHPSSPWGGGFTIVYANDVVDSTHGLTLRLHRDLTGNIANLPGLHVINPNQAANIDRKMDDGMSNAGWVQSEYAGSLCDAGGNYDEQLSQKNCWMMFTID
jgi:prepilin-type N-terminal cleavage/methylation domain-containing protein